MRVPQLHPDPKKSQSHSTGVYADDDANVPKGKPVLVELDSLLERSVIESWVSARTSLLPVQMVEDGGPVDVEPPGELLDRLPALVGGYELLDLIGGERIHATKWPGSQIGGGRPFGPHFEEGSETFSLLSVV